MTDREVVVAGVVEAHRRGELVGPDREEGWAHEIAEDLTERPRSGRPPAAEAITDECIRRELAKSPMSLGYSTTTWTVKTLANHLSRNSDCPLTERTLRRRMRGMGLCWKRPRYVYSTKDPHRAQKKGRSCAACGGPSPAP